MFNGLWANGALAWRNITKVLWKGPSPGDSLGDVQHSPQRKYIFTKGQSLYIRVYIHVHRLVFSKTTVVT